MNYGIIPVASASQLEADALRKAAAEKAQSSPMVQALAGHVRKRWELVRNSRSAVEERLLVNLRQRSGEYDPAKLQEIRAMGGSEVYMGITSVKCRGASSWLRDTLLGTGADKPWSLDSTPIPELPPEYVEQVRQQLYGEVQQYAQQMMMQGGQIDEAAVRARAKELHDQLQQLVREESRLRVERMELKMEDQQAEGGFYSALQQFIDDLVTFPTAILKGPIPRKRMTLKWDGTVLQPTETIRIEWERVDPFKVYPAPWASSLDDGFLIEHHSMTRGDLEALIGVEGYNADAINTVLAEASSGSLKEWLSIDIAQAEAEGKNTSALNEADLIDAIQLWDEVTGDKLLEWGLSADEITDKTKSYPCEIWLINTTVIKAVLNYDPLGRKPYFATSYEKIPGAFWGNGVPDLIRDCQTACNGTARALMNNMGLASGPQVSVNISRLAAGEKVSQLYPWKLWQFQSTDYQDSSSPIQFFQPQSNAQELLAVFERFSSLADEYSGIPRYMTGEHQAGVGRTSSGLSMLISNASKGLKQVINNVDTDCLSPLLTRQYQHNLRYSDDPDLIGDVTIVAKGAMSLVVKEAAAVRRTEFLQLALNSQAVQSVIGLPGVAELLRDAAGHLDMNVERIVPSREAIASMVAQQAAQQQQILDASTAPETEQVAFQRDDAGAVVGATKKKPRTLLPDGSPAGGRAQSLMVNHAAGSSAAGGPG